MTFNGFQTEDFATFSIDGLSERMEAIQQRIQPKFQAIYNEIADDLDEITGIPMHLHIARHARRTVNPPADTWSAYCHNKRGYKKHPHFQVGLWHDNVFVWLAYIYELPGKQTIGENFIKNVEDLRKLIPPHYHISKDHMQNDAEVIQNADVEATLQRFTTVKKGELLIGRRFDKNDEILYDGERFIAELKDIIRTLAPLYQSSLEVISD